MVSTHCWVKPKSLVISVHIWNKKGLKQASIFFFLECINNIHYCPKFSNSKLIFPIYMWIILKWSIHHEITPFYVYSISKNDIKILSFLTWSCICQLFQPITQYVFTPSCMMSISGLCHYWQSYCSACSGIKEVWREYMQQSFIILS